MNFNFKVAILIFLLFQFIGSNNEVNTHSRENILVALGTTTDSREFKEYKQFWSIDKNFENRNHGMKLFIGSLNNKVESIYVAGEDCYVNNADFKKFPSALPFGLLWDDNVESLQRKLGEGQKLIGRNAIKFYNGNIAIEAMFNNTNKMAGLRFFNEPKRLMVPNSNVAEVKRESGVSTKMKEGLKEFEPKPVMITNAPLLDTSVMNHSSFKKAILEVFRSYNESKFSSIKGDLRASRNFWNYQFTYSTKLKIPGEKFNMLYSFPFVNSPLDFVSVIKESDTYDQSIESAHKSFEKKLLENFSAKDGWVASCIPNKESKKLSDLEFRNDKYGAVILDYSRNPKGKHVVYLRFLLFSS